jgi:hypothetical protein
MYVVIHYQLRIVSSLLACFSACSSAEAGQAQYVELLQQLLAAQGATLEVRACTARRVQLMVCSSARDRKQQQMSEELGCSCGDPAHMH